MIIKKVFYDLLYIDDHSLMLKFFYRRLLPKYKEIIGILKNNQEKES